MENSGSRFYEESVCQTSAYKSQKLLWKEKETEVGQWLVQTACKQLGARIRKIGFLSYKILLQVIIEQE